MTEAASTVEVGVEKMATDSQCLAKLRRTRLLEAAASESVMPFEDKPKAQHRTVLSLNPYSEGKGLR